MNICLTKRRGIYYLCLTSYAGTERTFKFVSCKTRIKNQALKFLKSYEKMIENKNKSIDLLLEECFEKIIKIKDYNSRTKLIFKRFIEIVGNKKLNEVTKEDFENYKLERIKYVKPVTVNIEIRTLKVAFNKFFDWGYIKQNVVYHLKQIKLTDSKIISFSEQEISYLISNIQYDIIKKIVLFAYLTGFRISEILNVQLGDIDFENKILTVKNKEDFKTKSRKDREIPISDNLLELIKEILKFDGKSIIDLNKDRYLFSYDWNKKYTRCYVSSKFKKELLRLGFDSKYHFHSLRHSTATNLIKKGISINFVKDILGHSSITTTMLYAKLNTEDLRQAVNCL